MTNLFNTRIASVLLIAAGLLSVTVSAQAYEHHYHHGDKMHRHDAEHVVWEAHPDAHIFAHKYKSSGIGSHPNYIFDVETHNNQQYRVVVDAYTGKIVENTREK